MFFFYFHKRLEILYDSYLRELNLLVVAAVLRPHTEGPGIWLFRSRAVSLDKLTSAPQVVDDGELDQGREDEGRAGAHPDVNGLSKELQSQIKFCTNRC